MLYQPFRPALGCLFLIFSSMLWAAPKYKVLYSFQGGSEGAIPYVGSLAVDHAGNVYGVTYWGGVSSCTEGSFSGCGTVFELIRLPDGSWKEKLLYEFQGGKDGAQPHGLVIDSAGNLYGTTEAGGGGGPDGCLGWGSGGCGIVYQLTPSSIGTWRKTTLHSFAGRSDGGNPNAELVLDAAGNIYGVTYCGGIYPCDQPGGVVFELSPGKQGLWIETVLYAFSGNPDGFGPNAGLAADTDGNLYGTTIVGGTNGMGTVFKLTAPAAPGGQWTESLIHSFNGLDGSTPEAAVILDGLGNVNGTTYRYGFSCCGTVFELSPTPGGQWNAITIHSFTDGVDGGYPWARLLLDRAGNLYGIASSGGDPNCGGGGGCGVVFAFTRGQDGRWSQTILHSFTEDSQDGGGPAGDLIFDPEGHLYGTTMYGGADGSLGSGTVFEMGR